MSEQGSEPIDPAPIRDRIDQAISALFPAPTSPPSRAAESLTQLVLLLARWAPRMNLTGHRDPLEMTSRLVLDAAALVATLPELATAPSLADLGSGAGFPGLPIAILCPTVTVRLVESRQKRHHFQREVRRQLALDNAIPLLGRSDQIVVAPSSIVVAQAMTSPDRALVEMLAWMAPGGMIVLPAADGAPSPEVPAHLQVERRRYRVPLTQVDRQLWVVRSLSL